MIDPSKCHVQGERIVTPKGDLVLLTAPTETAPQTYKAMVRFEGRARITEIPPPLVLAWQMAGGHVHQEKP